jgi:hypothetical protein
MENSPLTMTRPIVHPSPLFLFSVVAALLLLFTPVVHCDDPPEHQPEQPLSRYGGAHGYETALNKLQLMSPEEIRDLDRQLAEALILYYDSEYAKALPLFQSIAEQVETSDILFWIGMSAMRSGRVGLAAEQFRRMLERAPELDRVRLELATAYFSMGRYDDAKKELETVRTGDPPPEVSANIDKLLAAIEERTRKVTWNVRLSTGYMWDDNVASGPEDKEYSVGGGTLTPDETILRREDEAWTAQVDGNVLVDFGGFRGWMWNSGLSFYHKDYFRYNEYNFQSADLYTGPVWQGKQGVFKMPFGFVERHFGRSRLSYAFHIDPSYEHFFTPSFSLKGLYSISKEHFYNDDNRNLHNRHYRFRLTPSVYLGEKRNHILSAFWGYDTHDAREELSTYGGATWGFSYYTRFPTDTEIYLSWQKSHREYNGIVPLYDEDRADDRSLVSLVISQRFFDHYFATIKATYLDNDSNLEIYGYDRTTVSTSVGCRF